MYSSLKPIARSFLPVLGLVLSACATRQDILDLHGRLDALESTLATIQKNQADTLYKIDDLGTQIDSLKENTNSSQYHAGRLMGKIEDLEVKLEKKVPHAVPAPAPAPVPPVPAAVTSSSAPQPSPQTASKADTVSNPAIPSAGAPESTPGEIYQKAYRHFLQKNFDLAVEGFKMYLDGFPTGQQTDQAAYYLGESYFEKQNWTEAAKSYAVILDHFPRSDLTPSSRLKYALCLLKFDVRDVEAKRYLQSIPQDFPKSPEAHLAKEYLKKFGQKK